MLEQSDLVDFKAFRILLKLALSSSVWAWAPQPTKFRSFPIHDKSLPLWASVFCHVFCSFWLLKRNMFWTFWFGNRLLEQKKEHSAVPSSWSLNSWFLICLYELRFFYGFGWGWVFNWESDFFTWSSVFKFRDSKQLQANFKNGNSKQPASLWGGSFILSRRAIILFAFFF